MNNVLLYSNMLTRSSNLFKKSIEVDHLKFLFESIPKNQKSANEYSDTPNSPLM